MSSIRLTLVRNVLTANGSSNDEEDNGPDDVAKVSALDWLLYAPPERENAILECNGLARFFVAEHKPQLAAMALRKAADMFAQADVS